MFCWIMAVDTQAFTRHLVSRYRQSSLVSPTGRQLYHIKNKVRHETSLRNFMKQERVPPERHRGSLGVGKDNSLKADTGVTFAD